MINEFKPVLKNPNFVYVWISQILSQLTINIMNFLLLTRLFQTTGSAIATSLLWVAYSIPSLLVGPIGAASVDLVDRRKMLMATNLLQALTIFIYTFLHQSRVFLLYGVAFAYSFLNQFYVPAESASIPSVVKKSHLPFANGLFFLTQQATLILGFGLAGPMNTLFGFTNSLYICAAFLFIAFVSTSFLPKLPVLESVPKNLESAVVKFFSSIAEGYSYVKARNYLIAPYLLLGGIWIILSVVVVNVPILAKDVLSIGLNYAGIAIVVPAGIGSAIGALLIPKIMRRSIRKKVIIEYSLMAISLSIFILAFVIPMLSPLTRIISAGLIIILVSAAATGIIIPTQTFLQEATPEGLRGRIFGNFWFLVTVATMLPIIFSGTVVELLGVKTLLLLITLVGIVTLVISKRLGQKFLEREVG